MKELPVVVLADLVVCFEREKTKHFDQLVANARKYLYENERDALADAEDNWDAENSVVDFDLYPFKPSKFGLLKVTMTDDDNIHSIPAKTIVGIEIGDGNNILVSDGHLTFDATRDDVIVFD